MTTFLSLRCRGLFIACLSPLTIVSTNVWAEALKVTPYRPTVSNPAYLPVPRYLEVEMGWQSLRGRSEDRHRHSVPYLLKFGFTERVGILVGGEAAIVEDRPGGPTQGGFGDASGILKLVHPLETPMPSALGLETGVKVPSAPTTVGSDRTDYFVNGIYSTGFGPFGLDLNLLYTRLGGAVAGEQKDELGWVTTASYSVTDLLGLAGEFFGSHREGVRPFLQYLTAVSYTVTPRVVADAGVAFGLTGASQEWTAFAGVTVLTWKLL